LLRLSFQSLLKNNPRTGQSGGCWVTELPGAGTAHGKRAAELV